MAKKLPDRFVAVDDDGKPLYVDEGDEETDDAILRGIERAKKGKKETFEDD